MKVLIADDSALVRERLVAMLSELSGVELVDQAEDGADAIRKIREVVPDVVVLDIRMPEANGIAVLRSIRRCEENPLVIVLTSLPPSEYKQKCMEAGADFFFDKSKDFEKVVEVVHALCRYSCAGLSTWPVLV